MIPELQDGFHGMDVLTAGPAKAVVLALAEPAGLGGDDVVDLVSGLEFYLVMGVVYSCDLVLLFCNPPPPDLPFTRST